MIELVGVRKSFDDQKVLDGCTLHVSQGETVAVIGRSGTGKSVMLRHLLGLIKPDAGLVLMHGQNTAEFRHEEWLALRAKIGMVFQHSALFDSMPVWENVGLGLLEHTRLSRNDVYEIVTRKLELVDLTDVLEKYPSQLSGGMRKRVALARAIARDPEIVLFDEPTTGLDPITTEVINELLIRLRDQLRITAVVVTHDLASVRKVADRILLLHDGKIVGEETPATLDTTSNPYFQQFVRGEAHGPLEGGGKSYER